MKEPTHTYSGNSSCPVRLWDIVAAELVGRSVSCRHAFHPSCLLTNPKYCYSLTAPRNHLCSVLREAGKETEAVVCWCGEDCKAKKKGLAEEEKGTRAEWMIGFMYVYVSSPVQVEVEVVVAMDLGKE